MFSLHRLTHYATCLLVIISLPSLTQGSKPFSKRQQTVWRLECELGVISDPECPVDGAWAPWGPWSPCRGPCDDLGRRRRTRRCNNPPPTEDGTPCTGPDEEIETCYLTNCTVEDYRKVIEGDLVRSEAFHQLEAVPALMERCLQVECPFEAIEGALANDNIWQLNPEALWNSLQCVKHNMGCPVVGEWGVWGAWSACGARCGEGSRWRLRRCDTPPPSDSRLVCPGTPLQAEQCEGDQCTLDVERDAIEAWGPWGAWTPCSENCGYGVTRRRRTCVEPSSSRAVGTWGTHCAGPHDECVVCERKECLLDGGWSGWGSWGPCSQPCGAGKKSRTRSCTRPIPAGGGTHCSGLKGEVGSCYLNPCEAHSHIVALLNGESLLQYNFENKRSTLFQFYVRFMPLSPHGTLVRRGTVRTPHVRLSLQKWHVCLDAGGSSMSCTLPRICSPSVVEPAIWHTAMITVSSEAATLRIDDSRVPIRSTFLCDPDLPDENMNILVGEKFHGGLQELVLNFIPLDMGFEREHSKRCNFCPSSVSNVVYETAPIDEAYLHLENEQYLRLPCFDDQDEWRLELTIKSKREVGTILFLRDDTGDTWFHMGLQNMRLKLKIAVGDFRSESSSSTECPPNQWLDVTLTKKRDSNTIEASINAGELLHVVFEEETTRERRGSSSQYGLQSAIHSNSLKHNVCTIANTVVGADHPKKLVMPVSMCNDEFHVGGIPGEIGRYNTSYDFASFTGVIASISINNVILDLHKYSVERYKDGEVQVSSRTASVSGSYHEMAWGKSNRLNLTCLHARNARSPNTAHWFFLDTSIKGAVRDKTVRSVDDGRVLRLVASADNDLRGFYTCRAHANKRTHNIVTYGVLGKIKYRLSSPDATTAVAVVTTLALIISTLAWLVMEGIHDLRNGFGFFRDAHLSPEEEAEAVCKYIDENIHLIGSESAAKIAKARARCKGRRLASRASFAAQEPQGMKQIENMLLSEESSDLEELPALPAIKTLAIESSHDTHTYGPGPSHDVYRCEPCYISSPRHGSNLTSPRTKVTSTSSVETSPRSLCSRLLLAKRIHSSRETPKLKTRSKYSRQFDSPRKIRSNLLTIKSSTYMELSPAQKILQKFQQLRNDDE